MKRTKKPARKTKHAVKSQPPPSPPDESSLPTHYVDPHKLRAEIIAYKKKGKMSEELGEMMIKIAKRYASKPNFSGYTYKEDFINDAIFRMVNQMAKINLDHPKSNPFAYLTLICHRVFLNKIYAEKRFQSVKTKYQETMYAEFERTENINQPHKSDEKRDIFDVTDGDQHTK